AAGTRKDLRLFSVENMLWSRNNVAVRILFFSTAMLITRLRVSYASASDPLPYFQRLDRAEYITWVFWLLISAGTSLLGRLCRGPGSGLGFGAAHVNVGGRVRGPADVMQGTHEPPLRAATRRPNLT